MVTFKTSARTLDLLGNQQIAGIPSAINELFKNAHDAYANYVVADYYRERSILTIRDDGFGMTKDDFIEKWLTLGTDSKFSGMDYVPPNKVSRKLMGEKGIGRLSIASIGSHVLVLTRANRNEHIHDLVCAYIHWGIFECPGVHLEEIEIPLKVFTKGQFPTSSDIDVLFEKFINCIDKLENKNEYCRNAIARIKKEIRSVKGTIEPSSFGKGRLVLSEDNCGTHFIILSTNDSLDASIDESMPGTGQNEFPPPLITYLLGFSNSMKKNEDFGDRIKTALFDHKLDGSVENVIDDKEFFTYEDFVITDHHIEGNFDEYGQFNGIINIFGKVNHENHIINWKNSLGVKTSCGPFKISLALVQGDAKQSSIPSEKYQLIINKCRKIGGVYIYKDDIRILPYGNFDYDWLGIELRRTKSAGYYFFSHRNLFGYVELTKKNNSNLKEKAGREGFRENRAYRQLREILINFFLQLAADFFRKSSVNTEWIEYAEAFEKRHKLLERRQKRLKNSKEEFELSLSNFFYKINNDAPRKEMEELLSNVGQLYERIIRKSEISDISQDLLDIERQNGKAYESWKNSYVIVRPKGISFSKRIEEDWVTYRKIFSELELEVFYPTRRRIEDIALETQRFGNVIIDQRRRFEVSLNELIEKKEKESKAESSELTKKVEEVKTKVEMIVKEKLSELQKTSREVLADFNRMDMAAGTDEELVDIKLRLEDRINIIGENAKSTLQRLREQLQYIRLDHGNEYDDGDKLSDEMEALEAEYIALKEERVKDIELIQMGQAISVIQHEFNSQVINLRDNLKGLKAWADLNERLRPLYSNLKVSFDHLDGYLKLFTPLQRRTRRTRETFEGQDIVDFLGDLFKDRFKRHNIEFKSLLPFRKMKIFSFRSVFYPVFVNIMDNSVFWLKDISCERVITLDYHNNIIYIKDTGPGISVNDTERIFEPGFSRKPGGAGLGLYIVRETLKGEGYRIELQVEEKNKGTCFLIQKSEEKFND